MMQPNERSVCENSWSPLAIFNIVLIQLSLRVGPANNVDNDDDDDDDGVAAGVANTCPRAPLKRGKSGDRFVSVFLTF